MGPLLGLLLLAAAPVRPFTEDRVLLDRRLETLRRMLPDGANPGPDVALLTDFARGAGATFDIHARAPLEAGGEGNVPVDVAGNARFAEIDRFFRQVSLSARLIDVESLTLSAGPGDMVRMTALLQLPYRPLRTPLPAPPEGLRARLSDVARPVADAYLRDQALALSKSDTAARLRRTRRNPRLFLAELASIVRDRPVVLKEAQVSDEFVVRGLTVGEGPMRALEMRLERGFFRVAEVLMARSGACHRFEVRGRSPVVGIEAELPLPAVDDPFRQDDGPCVVDRDGGGLSVLRIPPMKPVARGRVAPPPRGTLSLRLRDMDLTDVFFVLHLATGQGFLVDEDVRGRVSLEVSQVALDDVLALLAKSGAAVSPPGPLRRVSRTAARATLPAATGEGTPMTFALKRAPVADVLAVIADADPSLPPLARLVGRLSLWAREVHLSDVRAAVLQATRPEGAASADGDPPPAVMPERRLLVRSDELSVSEFHLAGVATGGEGWIAFAYAPTGVLNAYRRGDKLADGSAAEIQSTDVMIATEEGPVRILLPDPGH